MSKPSKSWPEVRARNCASKAKRASFSDWNLFRDAAEALREHGQSAGRIGDEAYAVCDEFGLSPFDHSEPGDDEGDLRCIGADCCCPHPDHTRSECSTAEMHEAFEAEHEIGGEA